ncbi:MAG TPA: type II toxin-antitoxin system VapC family toxin, partial [Anaerolineae bacterium]|nr:type II toxin-antitoxin system VapC family toxin [Anaerolineae bacterium]
MRRSPICVDASFVLELVTCGGYRSPVVQLWSGWRETGRPVVAPTLLHYEVSHALGGYAARGELLPDEATQALEAALGLGITFYDDAELHRQALGLTGRLSL